MISITEKNCTKLTNGPQGLDVLFFTRIISRHH
jgi:hypothetical protein